MPLDLGRLGQGPWAPAALPLLQLGKQALAGDTSGQERCPGRGHGAPSALGLGHGSQGRVWLHVHDTFAGQPPCTARGHSPEAHSPLGRGGCHTPVCR